MSKETAIDYLVAAIWSGNTEPPLYLKVIIDRAREKEREQMMKTWTRAIDQTQERAWNVVRAYDDFDDYYNEAYGDDTCQFEAHLNSTSATKCKWCGLEKWQHKTYGGDK